MEDASPSWEETAHACVAEASRSPSPSVSEADVWVSAASRGMSSTPLGRRPPRAARAPRRHPHPPWIRGRAQRAAAPCPWATASVPSRTCTPSVPHRCTHGKERQGRSVERAEGPLHRRPRLRHRTRRRGAASAASRPPQARARVVETVRLSAQPPADRSVQRLIRRRRWTAPAHGWAARRRSCPRRLGNALEQTLRLASPIRPPGAQRKAPAPLRSARATDSAHPHTPPGALRIATAPGW